MFVCSDNLPSYPPGDQQISIAEMVSIGEAGTAKRQTDRQTTKKDEHNISSTEIITSAQAAPVLLFH